ncbi:hypothetical protein CIB48_g1372 [Xylaria polymorpha]|nr:hypothetical protein CIB48_g1372 [Xylaria polymorpha]
MMDGAPLACISAPNEWDSSRMMCREDPKLWNVIASSNDRRGLVIAPTLERILCLADEAQHIRVALVSPINLSWRLKSDKDFEIDTRFLGMSYVLRDKAPVCSQSNNRNNSF